MTRALAFLIALLVCGSLAAQPAPFDMSGERPAGEPAPPQRPDAAEPKAGSPGLPAATAAEPDRSDEALRRYIIPFRSLSLTGETDRRTWSVYLTPGQAAAARALTFSYQNAIVVAPEASLLSVFVNGTLIGEGPVQAADAPQMRSYALPAGLLRTGSNEIRFQVRQRHRTDCTIESTYELWTEIASDSAFISFENGAARALTALEDIQAVGQDGAGRTRFNIVAPALEQPSRTAALMRLAEGLALFGHMPTQTVLFRQDLPAAGEPGELTVLAGTASELAPVLRSLPPEASTTPVATFVREGADRAPLLVVSGPDWPGVEQAIEMIAKATDRPVGVARDVINTERWRLPETPQVLSGKRLSFSELGVETSEFSGRRFRTAFAVAIPSDFYADAYGEARVLLDAAYTDVVRPGSRIDIYVNGSIATTVPVDSARGGIMRHLPINVTLRHFRPGPNLIELEAVLLTESDRACAPGSAASPEPRFALFDSSEFEMPDFARIARRPDLAATAGSAYPYGGGRPIALYLDRTDADTLSAAATFVARLAVSGGRPIPIEMLTSPLAAANRNTLFVGAIPQLSKTLLTQAGIDTDSQFSWGNAAAGVPGRRTQIAFNEWQTRLKGGGGVLLSVEQWIKDRFDISLSSLQLIPSEEAPFAPPDTATLLVAQAADPTANAAWTVVTAPSPELLREGVSVIADVSKWGQLAGHISIYEPANDRVTAIAAKRLDFVPTTPPSFWNYRLIAANWLSTNILYYAVLLVSLATLLGLATAILLGKLGRRS